MRRQFLRVYLGIAFVLLAAAGLTLVVVDREMQRVVDDRLEEAVEPWVWRLRQRLLRGGDSPQERTQALAQLQTEIPFPVTLAAKDSVKLPARARRRLDAERPALVAQDSVRLVYAELDERTYLVLGPLPARGQAPGGRFREAGLPRRGPAAAPPSWRGHALGELAARGPTAVRIESRAHRPVPPAAASRLDAGKPFVERTPAGLTVLLPAGPDSVVRLEFGAAGLPAGAAADEPAGAADPTAEPGGPADPTAGPAPAYDGPGDEPLPPRPDGPGGNATPASGRRPLPFQGAYALIGALLGILLVIGAAVYWLLHPFERRILALADVTHEFGTGQFARRADVAGTDAIAVLARRFNEMADRLVGLIERQRELLRAVSHELRTPMARLFFLVDDAQHSDDAQQRQSVLRRMEHSLQELNDLVEELLTFVRLEGPADTQESSPVEVTDLFADVAALVKDLRPGIQVATDAAGVRLVAVPRLLRRAVLNLATNAARHARARVSLVARQSGDRTWIHVDDDGPGVPAEARQRVFEPFCRLDPSRSSDSGGIGLGLAIVQRIALVHGGRAEVAVSPAGGARFTLELPTSA